MIELSANPSIRLYEDVAPEPLRTQVGLYLQSCSWQFGGTSGGKNYPYWYRHFAGIFDQRGVSNHIKDCAPELAAVPPIAAMWDLLRQDILKGHVLTRCYANSYPYGCEGTIHIDANDTRHYTSIFYPNAAWDLNWAGETMFFGGQPPEILAVVWPRPNRMVVFQGTVPHVARGISRVCPVLRTTLMFKTVLS